MAATIIEFDNGVHEYGFGRNQMLRNCAKKAMVHNIATTTTPSTYTSQGKKKCVAGEPFRTQEDIIKAKKYLASFPTKINALRNVAIFTLGISVGIRGNDLLRLQIRDIMRPDGEIVDELMVYESKTNKINHPIVNDEAKAAIKEYLSARGALRPTDYLFHSHKGGHITADSFYNILKKMQVDLELDYPLTIRSLRKTFAYWTIKLHPNDVNVMASLQEMLNHNDMKTTLHYSGHAKDHLKVMYEDMANVFDETKLLDAVKDNPKFESKLDKILEILMEDDNN